MTCTAVQELYRSSLVCPLIPILKGVFWSKRQSCTVLGSMLTGFEFFQWKAMIAMEKFKVVLLQELTGQVWYVH